MLEIERKWVIGTNDLKHIEKNYKCKSESKIEQIYLCEGTRIRKRVYDNKTEYTRTTKEGSGMVRSEQTEHLTKFQYLGIKLYGVKKLNKKRMVFELEGGLEMEVDIYPNQDFILLEIEFDSQVEAESFVEPFSFQKEVTGDRDFNNFYIARGV